MKASELTMRRGLAIPQNVDPETWLSPAHQALSRITLDDPRERAFMEAARTGDGMRRLGTVAVKDGIWILYLKHCERPDMPRVETRKAQRELVHGEALGLEFTAPALPEFVKTARATVELMGVRRRAAALRVIYGEAHTLHQ